MKNYFIRHMQVLFYSLGQLARAPFASLMSLMVIGISLALPAGLYVSLDNMQRLSAGWGGNAQISVFLKSKVSYNDSRNLAIKLQYYSQNTWGSRRLRCHLFLLNIRIATRLASVTRK